MGAGIRSVRGAGGRPIDAGRAPAAIPVSVRSLEGQARGPWQTAGEGYLARSEAAAAESRPWHTAGTGVWMKAGIAKETHEGERRVAATPKTVERLVAMGFEVLVEKGAGRGARLYDEDYVAAGARLVDGAPELWAEADLILKVRPPSMHGEPAEVDLVRPGQVIVSLVHPAQNDDLVHALAQRGATVLALDQIPRISRAQKMDVLSSMANIAGYRAVIEAANIFGSFFGGQITAAGRTRPARVLVIGAGVAGLAAIATARALGAEVRAFDVRVACKEQVESLGASFLELDFERSDSGETAGGYASTMSPEFIEAEMALFAQQCREVDIVITTALIPGKPAPLLITKEMVESMRPGSVVVDLAAQNGGNCAYTEPDRSIEIHGVTVIGYTDLTSRLATHASQFFGTNLAHLLDDLGGATAWRLDTSDEVVRNALVVHEGRITWPPPPEAATAVAGPPAVAAPQPPTVVEARLPEVPPSTSTGSSLRTLGLAAGAGLLLLVGAWAPADFVQHLTVFVLACFVGWQVIWNVTPALHTPLMSVTNAISGIIVVGGILQASSGQVDLPSILGAVAVLVASINIAGGFLVTERMLHMFRREG